MTRYVAADTIDFPFWQDVTRRHPCGKEETKDQAQALDSELGMQLMGTWQALLLTLGLMKAVWVATNVVLGAGLWWYQGPQWLDGSNSSRRGERDAVVSAA